MERAGNTISFSDGSGYLWIAPACSSIANVSLAILCWVLFTQMFYRERPIRHAWWAVLACALVVAINVTRLSLIGLYQQHFDLLHGPVGATVANWLSFAAIIGICALGVKREIPVLR
jgi:exosortase/archaeosortase family protein